MANPSCPPDDLSHKAKERWRAPIVRRDPATFKLLKTGRAGIEETSIALTVCFEERAWDWIEQLWPPRPDELNQPAFVNQWVLDAMEQGETQRAMALYQRANVEKNLGELLSLAVVRADPALWETLFALKDWSDTGADKAAVEFARWGSENRRHRELAKSWFMRLARSLPEIKGQASLVKVALDHQMNAWALDLIKVLPPPAQRLAALETYPEAERLTLLALQSHCWKALTTPLTEGTLSSPWYKAKGWMRSWLDHTSTASQQRLWPHLSEGERYAAWHAAYAAKKEEVVLHLWSSLRSSTAKGPRFEALAGALEEGDRTWIDRWWSPRLGAALNGEEFFQMVVLSFGTQDPALQAWVDERLDWPKLDRCMRARKGELENFEVELLDQALLKAPADVCQAWVAAPREHPLALPLATARVQAIRRRDQAQSTAPASRASSRPRVRS